MHTPSHRAPRLPLGLLLRSICSRAGSGTRLRARSRARLGARSSATSRRRGGDRRAVPSTTGRSASTGELHGHDAAKGPRASCVLAPHQAHVALAGDGAGAGLRGGDGGGEGEVGFGASLVVAFGLVTENQVWGWCERWLTALRELRPGTFCVTWMSVLDGGGAWLVTGSSTRTQWNSFEDERTRSVRWHPH